LSTLVSMNFTLEKELSKANGIQQVNQLKSQVDALRPLPADVERKVMQKLTHDWNYHSNAIEGNGLSYGETVALLQHGTTANGKALKDHLDIRGHNTAIDFLLGVVKEEDSLSEAYIGKLHTMLLVEPYIRKVKTPQGIISTQKINLGKYKTIPNHVRTSDGELHYYISPEETPAKMRELVEWYNAAITQSDIHPLVIASLFHHKFVAIHPFDDGNGRLARILMNMILLHNQYPPVVIKADDQQNYYDLLSQADTGQHQPFVDHITQNMLASLNLFLKAADGHDIEEDEDINQEIAHFRLQIKEQVKAKTRKSYSWIRAFLKAEINPFLTKLVNTVKPFGDDFTSSGQSVDFIFVIEGFLLPTTKIFNDEVLELIKERFSILKGVNLTLNFKRFKNPDNAFDISSVGYIYFEEFKYDIYGNKHKLILSKSYSESLTADDYKKITRSFIDDIKTQIQEQIK
jgi:Fic family protein